MFQSYQYIRPLDYDQKTNQYRHEYKIVDSDFEEAAVGYAVQTVLEVVVGVAVIDTYERKKLPVPINLALAFKYIYDQHRCNFENTIFYNLTYNPKYLPYAEETEQQLQRIMDMQSFW